MAEEAQDSRIMMLWDAVLQQACKCSRIVSYQNLDQVCQLVLRILLALVGFPQQLPQCCPLLKVTVVHEAFLLQSIKAAFCCQNLPGAEVTACD